MSRFQLRRAHVALASAAVLVALACSKSDAPPKDTAKPAAAAGATAAATPQPLAGAARGLRRARKAWPGDLTKPIDDYTGDEFHDFVKRLSYAGGHERQRRCKKTLAARAQSRRGTRRCWWTPSPRRIPSAPSNTHQFGVVYVRAINKGDAPEERYGMLPGKQYEYYMIITADSSGNGNAVAPGAARYDAEGAQAFEHRNRPVRRLQSRVGRRRARRLQDLRERRLRARFGDEARTQPSVDCWRSHLGVVRCRLLHRTVAAKRSCGVGSSSFSSRCRSAPAALQGDAAHAQR